MHLRERAEQAWFITHLCLHSFAETFWAPLQIDIVLGVGGWEIRPGISWAIPMYSMRWDIHPNNSNTRWKRSAERECWDALNMYGTERLLLSLSSRWASNLGLEWLDFMHWFQQMFARNQLTTMPHRGGIQSWLVMKEWFASCEVLWFALLPLPFTPPVWGC